ncbi:ammonium transporter [Bremerella sp. JC817]|uniref:ammonium transporter n=1 Tax=Bremerella sp. JC817 TaxID=3231756 RepID=UPI00345999E3
MSSALPQLDIAWILLCSALVMLMQGGFCLLESGLVRAKNSFNVALKNLVDFCVSAAVFWVFGFAIMFGASYHGWFGTTMFCPGEDTSPWLMAFFIFQMVFCGTATTIISGAVAERIRFRGYFVIALLVSGLIYPLFGHWAWGGLAEGTATGWLAKQGFIDFAGSTVVHSVGGWVSLAAILIIGPRIGRFDGERPGIHGHNLTLATFGVLLLWFGWFGFNGGSTLAMNDSVPRIIVNTNLAAAFGGLACLVTSWLYHRRPDVGHTMNGVVAGLVGVTASCHIVAPWAAVLIGCGSGVICCIVTELLPRLKIDDVIGAFPAHACAGAFGTLALAFLADPSHFGEGMTAWSQFLIQLKGVGACFLLAFVGGFTLIYLVNAVLPLRTTEEHERAGLNVSEHGASTELIDLLENMSQHRQDGDFTKKVHIEPHTEVGQIAAEYNRVLERVSSEMKQRAEAESRFRGIFENAVEGIYQTTPEGQFMTVNPALARMLGYENLIDISHSITDIATQVYVEPDRRAEFIDAIQQHGVIFAFESEIRRANGETMWISENASARFDADGHLMYYEGTVEDITQRRKARYFEAERNAAEAANRAKSDFLASMSHEIRTPLNGIIGFLDLLATTHLEDNQQRFVDLAKSSAGTLLHLINDILDLSKIEAGGIEFESSEFVLHDLVESVPELFSPQGRTRGLELNCCISKDVPTTVIGDPERIRQVLINLFSNAVKFTEHGGVNLHVTLAEKQSDPNMEGHTVVQFAVEDTGIGIPQSRLDRLFKAFSQVDASTTRKYGGTGLGLAICKQLSELMGGEIGVSSEAGKGSTFWFTVPLKAVERSTCDVIPNVTGLRVLAVDDNHMNLQVLKEQLQSWGVEITTASSGVRALDLMREAVDRNMPFQLAILDHIMPEMDGLTLADRIYDTSEFRSTKLLMLTSYDRDISSETLKRLDMTCLTKPIRQSRLLDTLVSLSGGRKSSASKPVNRQEDKVINDRRHEGKTILVVDDNEINRLVANEILTSEGFQVLLAENGREAVDKVAQAEVQLVLMDCEMPEMDGFEATRKIRHLAETTLASLENLPIVALTAQAIKGDQERCMAAGMNDYVMKPVNRQELIQTILKQLDLRAVDTPRPLSASEPPADMIDVEQQISLDELRERCGEDEDLVRRVLQKFAAKAKSEIDVLQQHIQAGRIDQVVQVAHSLKGMAANVAARSVSEVAGSIELAAREQRTDGYEQMVHDLNQNFDSCETAIRRLLNAAMEQEVAL